jgi:hypothetical protein
MNRATLTTALLSSFVCVITLACGPSADAPAQARADAASPAVEAVEPSPSAALPPASTAEIIAPQVDEPILASTTKPITPERNVEAPTNLRSPSLLPADTPAEHIAAFTNLPLSKRDKPPVGGVGASGIHLDELAVGKGWASSRCEELGPRFEVETDERVNVCFRVVHPTIDETVTVEWARAGKLRQTIEVGVRPNHSYLTRAWLPVSAGRVGEWTATIKSEDGSVLGHVDFQIVGSTSREIR